MRATIDGKEYELEFAGYDRATYRHLEGCLVHPGNPESRYGAPCQCGAADRADRWYQVKLPAAAPGDG